MIRLMILIIKRKITEFSDWMNEAINRKPEKSASFETSSPR